MQHSMKYTLCFVTVMDLEPRVHKIRGIKQIQSPSFALLQENPFFLLGSEIRTKEKTKFLSGLRRKEVIHCFTAF